MNPKCKISLTGRNLEITESIAERVNALALKIEEHDSKVESIAIELGLERHATSHHDEFSAKATVSEHKERFMASAKGDDLYAVVADLEQKLDRLIRRKSRRKVTERRHPKGIELDADIPKAG